MNIQISLPSLLALYADMRDTPEDIAHDALEFLVETVTPEQFGELIDGLKEWPQPFEQWDAAAAEWAYEALVTLARTVDLSKDPVKVRQRALRQAAGLSKREGKAAALLLTYLAENGANAQVSHAAKVLIQSNGREFKRNDIGWLLGRAVDIPEPGELKDAIQSAVNLHLLEA